jgi:hypothetical protein
MLATLHATDTLDVIAGVVQGWDVFEDNNSRPSFHGAVVWNSCDRRLNWFTAWVTGPEQPGIDDRYRNLFSSYVTALFGSHNQWRVSTGGHVAYEADVVADPATGNPANAEWYGYSVHLFYTIDPRMILGLRTEWFRDDDGTRTAYLKRPGFAASFYNTTLGFTYRPYQNLRVRPELRFDYCSDARPFNDLRDKLQTTAAFDVIWEF